MDISNRIFVGSSPTLGARVGKHEKSSLALLFLISNSLLI
jgi:hypothetical protein